MNIYTLLLEPTVTILEVNAFPILRGSKIYQQICVDKFVWFHSFRKTPACLEEKTNSRHIFVDLLEFAHFCRFCIFFPNYRLAYGFYLEQSIKEVRRGERCSNIAVIHFRLGQYFSTKYKLHPSPTIEKNDRFPGR